MPRFRHRALAAALTLAASGGGSAVVFAQGASAASAHHVTRPVRPRVVAHRRVPVTILVKRTGRGRVLSRRTILVLTTVVRAQARH